MKSLEEAHTEIEVSLKKIRAIIDDMTDQGLGTDLRYTYLSNRLIPSITKIFTAKD